MYARVYYKMADKNEKRKVLLQEKIKEILDNGSKINDIVDIIEELDSEDSSIAVECIDGLRKIFSQLINSGSCAVKKSFSGLKKKSKIREKPEEILQSWLSQNYTFTVNKLLILLHSQNPEVTEKCLSTLMTFLKAESQKLQETSKDFTFSNNLFLKVVTRLTDSCYSNDDIVKFFKPYLQYNDICYYLLRNLTKIISKFTNNGTESQQCGTHLAKNVYRLLQIIVMPQDEEKLNNKFVISHEEMLAIQTINNHNVMKLSSYKKAFTNAWMSFLSLSLDKSLYRQVLILLQDKVIPNLVDPKILMDFLVDSYNVGGVTSILSLNSLFVLIHQYNLDYPDFYKKLYSLFDVEIFHLKYRGRFFYLADLFLMSTHLPAYLVAAFIKRLSRLALRAPPSGVAMIVNFVGNLIRRHPNCKILIHRKKTSGKMNDENSADSSDKSIDPFKENETDPSQCEALQSSLWELETLRHHYYPEIKSLVELLEKPIDKNETDVSEYFESSYVSLFDDECTEFTKSNAFVEYHIPTGLLSDSVNELWCIDD